MLTDIVLLFLSLWVGEDMHTSAFIIILFLDLMRQYITQLRQEIGQRLIEKVYFPEDKPSKV